MVPPPSSLVGMLVVMPVGKLVGTLEGRLVG